MDLTEIVTDSFLNVDFQYRLELSGNNIQRIEAQAFDINGENLLV